MPKTHGKGRRDGLMVKNGYSPPRTDEQRDLDRAEMTHLLRRGWTQSMIAERFGISEETVRKDWKAVVGQLRRDRDEDTINLIAEKLEQYAEVKREAWDAWERSKKTHKKRVRESINESGGGGRGRKNVDDLHDDGMGGGRERYRQADTVEQQVGDPRFLEKILHCLEAERDLLSLDPVKKVQFEGTVVNWDILVQPLPSGPLPDEIEQELIKASLEHNTKLATLQAQLLTNDTSGDLGGIGDPLLEDGGLSTSLNAFTASSQATPDKGSLNTSIANDQATLNDPVANKQATLNPSTYSSPEDSKGGGGKSKSATKREVGSQGGIGSSHEGTTRTRPKSGYKGSTSDSPDPDNVLPSHYWREDDVGHGRCNQDEESDDNPITDIG